MYQSSEAPRDRFVEDVWTVHRSVEKFRARQALQHLRSPRLVGLTVPHDDRGDPVPDGVGAIIELAKRLTQRRFPEPAAVDKHDDGVVALSGGPYAIDERGIRRIKFDRLHLFVARLGDERRTRDRGVSRRMKRPGPGCRRRGIDERDRVGADRRRLAAVRQWNRRIEGARHALELRLKPERREAVAVRGRLLHGDALGEVIHEQVVGHFHPRQHQLVDARDWLAVLADGARQPLRPFAVRDAGEHRRVILPTHPE